MADKKQPTFGEKDREQLEIDRSLGQSEGSIEQGREMTRKHQRPDRGSAPRSEEADSGGAPRDDGEKLPTSG